MDRAAPGRCRHDGPHPCQSPDRRRCVVPEGRHAIGGKAAASGATDGFVGKVRSVMEVSSVSERARSEPGKVAFVLGDEIRTYAEFDERTTRLAHALRRRGVGAGDRVAVMLPNGFEFFETSCAM